MWEQERDCRQRKGDIILFCKVLSFKRIYL